MNRIFATWFLIIAIVNGALFVAWLSKHNITQLLLSGVICVLFSSLCIKHIFAEIKKNDSNL